jgi:hypothetical protein
VLDMVTTLPAFGIRSILSNSMLATPTSFSSPVYELSCIHVHVCMNCCHVYDLSVRLAAVKASAPLVARHSSHCHAGLCLSTCLPAV